MGVSGVPGASPGTASPGMAPTWYGSPGMALIWRASLLEHGAARYGLAKVIPSTGMALTWYVPSPGMALGPQVAHVKPRSQLSDLWSGVLIPASFFKIGLSFIKMLVDFFFNYKLKV